MHGARQGFDVFGRRSPSKLGTCDCEHSGQSFGDSSPFSDYWSTQMAEPNNSDVGTEPKPQVIYRCKKCRRIVASQEQIVPHKRGEGQKCFKWRKRSGNPLEAEKEPPDCSSIFVEPMKWMESVQEGFVEEKIQCMGCKARLGSFNWAGMQCNCGAWVNPAFQLHKNRIDECNN